MKGKTIKLEAAEEPRGAEVVDLMERLRQSLEKAGNGKAAKRARKPSKKGGARKRTRHAA